MLRQYMERRTAPLQMKEIETLLKENRIETLDLKFTSLSSTISHLATSLQMNTSLTSLDLWDTKLKEEGCAALVSGLLHNHTLKTLDLGSNRLGDRGCLVLVEGMARGDVAMALQSLGLDRNDLTDTSGIAIGSLLQRNQTLKTLSLRDNSIANNGAQAIADALVSNQRLTHLVLFHNVIGKKGATALADALEENHTLVSLDLACNLIANKQILRTIEQKCKENAQAETMPSHPVFRISPARKRLFGNSPTKNVYSRQLSTPTKSFSSVPVSRALSPASYSSLPPSPKPPNSPLHQYQYQSMSTHSYIRTPKKTEPIIPHEASTTYNGSEEGDGEVAVRIAERKNTMRLERLESWKRKMEDGHNDFEHFMTQVSNKQKILEEQERDLLMQKKELQAREESIGREEALSIVMQSRGARLKEEEFTKREKANREKEEQFRELERQLEQRRADIEKQLNAHMKELELHSKNIAAQRAELEEREKMVQEMEMTLMERENMAEQREKAVIERERAVAEREKHAKDREWEIKEQRREISKQELAMMEKAQILTERESEIELRERSLLVQYNTDTSAILDEDPLRTLPSDSTSLSSKFGGNGMYGIGNYEDYLDPRRRSTTSRIYT